MQTADQSDASHSVTERCKPDTSKPVVIQALARQVDILSQTVL